MYLDVLALFNDLLIPSWLPKDILGTHVFAGIAALPTGIAAMIAKPGSKIHRKIGMIYFWSMAIIFVTALLITLLIQFKIFLVVIAIFSFYMTFTGYRATKRKKPGQASMFDYLFAAIGLLSGIILVGFGIYQLATGGSMGTVILCSIFGSFLASTAYKDLKHFKKESYSKMWWWFHHLTMMMGSFIAAVTAFLVNNIYKVINLGNWDFIFWLLPTVILVPFISKWNKKYRQQFNID